MLARVQNLIELAEKAIGDFELAPTEEFVLHTESYMAQLEAWQSEMGPDGLSNFAAAISPEDKAKLKQCVTHLNELHAELIRRAETAKQQVGAEMGDLHKRAVGLRKYVDTYPSRVTITGKRKG